MTGTRSADSEVKLTFNATISNVLGTSAGAGNATSSANINVTPITGRLTDGVGSGQANRAWASLNRELGSGGQETLDLYQMIGVNIGAGNGKDALGQDCLFEEIVTCLVKHESGDGQLQIEPGSSNGLTALGTLTTSNGGALRAGGVRLWHEPGADAIELSSTKKNVKFSAIGGDLVYSIYIIGRHDDDESSSSSSVSSSSSTSSSSSSASSSSSSSSSSS